MKVNMNGLRSLLTNEFGELTKITELISSDIKKGNFDRMESSIDDFLKQHDKVAQYIGILNCTYDEENEGWTDQSEILKIRFLRE